MIIRLAENKDIENILSISKESKYISISENTLKNYMRENIYKVVVIENNNEVLGFLIFSFIFPEAEITDIAVSKKSQKTGKGHKLINYLIDFLKENKANKIILEVSSDNENACRFYKHLGFKEDGRRENYYTKLKKTDAILMSFNLL